MISVARLVEDKQPAAIDGGSGLQESLPLFSGSVFSGSMHVVSADLDLIKNNNVINQVDNFKKANLKANSKKRKKPSSGRQDHLACAKRLSRAMQQIPTNSRQHIQAGRLVCHHLVAMLHEHP